jgi:hypothetical protein
MQFLVAILLIGAAAGYLASIPCRLLYARHKCPGWFLGVASAFSVAILTLLVIYQGDVFHADELERVLMLMVFGFSIVAGLIPALLIVGYYRRRFRDETPVA